MISTGIEFGASAGAVIIIQVGVGLGPVIDKVDVDSLTVVFGADWRDRCEGIFGFVPKFAPHARAIVYQKDCVKCTEEGVLRIGFRLFGSADSDCGDHCVHVRWWKI